MIRVNLIASRGDVRENIDNLREIVKLIKDENHEIVRDWIDDAYEKQSQQKTTAADWTEIYRGNLESIAKSDIIIAETTNNSFGVGYQIAVATHQKKPILLLRHERAQADAFATGIVDPWVKRVTYNDDNLKQHVHDFLMENDIATKDMRFNFFIDRGIYNYLRWAALKTGKTKAEVLRELVNREIENKTDD